MIRFTAFAIAVVFAIVPGLAQGQEKKDRSKDEPVIGGITMNFVKVPKGAFWMGWSSYVQPKWKSKQVEFKQDFEMATCPVIQKHWEAVMGKNPSWFSRQGGGKEKVEDILDGHLDRFPVEMVSWNDAQEFVQELNKREKGKGWVYRLPTQAEWEYACREAATSKEDCSFDFYLDKRTNDISSKQANISAAWIGGKLVKDVQLFRPAPVGSYKPNKLGLYDMHGNVRQWCGDGDDAAGYPNRGGCFSQPGYQASAGYRQGFPRATYRECDIGVRVVRVRSEAKK